MSGDPRSAAEDDPADVVTEWSTRRGRPFDLTLTGPASGRWQVGTGAEQITLDAVKFWRALAGRGSTDGLLRTPAAF